MSVIVSHLQELWRYRALIDALVRRELKSRYRGSALGYLWTLLNPLFQLIVYRIVFTKLTRAVDMPNYAVFFFVGILPWLWLSTSLANATSSLTGNAGLITRACMPPQVLPFVSVVANFVNFLLALPVAIAAAAWYDLWPAAALAALPAVAAVQMLFLYGLSLALATLNVSYRDVQFLVQNLMIVWFLGTPIAYPMGNVEGTYRTILEWNPATAIVVPYQQILYERRLPDLALVGAGLVWAIALVLAAVLLYERRRDTVVEDV